MAKDKPLYVANEAVWREYGERLGLDLTRYKGRDKVRAAVIAHIQSHPCS